MKKLSIVIPAYNEEKFIGELLKIIDGVDIESIGFEKEVVVVNDGSADNTAEIVSQFKNVTLINQENQGKGSAVQNGIRSATGDYVLVQDADLEYFPSDYIPMLKALKEDKGNVIYGSRVLGQIEKTGKGLFPGRHESQSFGPWLAGVLLTIWAFLLYGKWITDTLTAYKIYPMEAMRKFTIKTKGFETDHEITSKLIRGGYRIHEVPIKYDPRSAEEGKKIQAIDGFIAVWTFLRFRFVS